MLGPPFCSSYRSVSQSTDADHTDHLSPVTTGEHTISRIGSNGNQHTLEYDSLYGFFVLLLSASIKPGKDRINERGTTIVRAIEHDYSITNKKCV